MAAKPARPRRDIRRRRFIETVMEVLYSDDAHVVEFHRSAGDCRRLLYTFTPFMTKDLRQEGFGVSFATRQGFDVVAFKCCNDSWYQQLEPDVLRTIAERSKEYSFVATYGSSMGGFAAIALSGIPGADMAVAISPQHSIDAEFDRRWAAQAAAIGSFRYRISPETAHGDRLVLIYDDRNALDVAQIDRIRRDTRFTNVREVTIPFSGHPAGHYLAQTGQITPVIGAILRGEEDIVVRRDWSMVRRSAAYLVSLAQHAMKHERNGLAVLGFSRAVALVPHNPGFSYHLSLALHRVGRLREAIEEARRTVSLAPNDAGFLRHLSNLLDQTASDVENDDQRSA